MNAKLTKVFTRDEVIIALQQLHPTKAPGPDGMFAIFFHKYWDIVGHSITNMVLNVLNSNMPITEIKKPILLSSQRPTSPPKWQNFAQSASVTPHISLFQKSLLIDSDQSSQVL